MIARPGTPEFREFIERNIESHGQAVMGVLGDAETLAFMYTIGLHGEGLPELLIIGYSREILLVNLLCEEARARKHRAGFAHGELVDIGGKLPLMAVNTDARAQDDYTFQATHHWGTTDYRVTQLVVPDTEGRWPWDPSCAEPFNLQPVLAPGARRGSPPPGLPGKAQTN